MKDFEKINKEIGTNYTSDSNEISWYLISAAYNLSEEFIREFADKVDWNAISICQKLSEPFIREFKNEVDWEAISAHQKLSEDFIKEFKDRVDWIYISRNQKLSESFIRKFQDKVDWFSVSEYQKLSEDFIREFKDKIKWYCISRYQALSEDFIRELQDEAVWNIDDINRHKNFPRYYTKETNCSITSCNIIDNWIYKTAEEKKQVLLDTGKYECYDDYFIAYKAIRNDRYSLFSFQYQYLPNEEYESWCDCSDNENSFGLSVGTYDFCKNFLGYKRGIIVKCKVKYEDIGRIVHDGNKIRCFKIKVLE